MRPIPYPEWLPEALQEGYGFQPVSPLVRSTFVSGRAMQRRAYTDTPTRVTVRWQLRGQISALFEKWFQEDLLDGSAWFLCKLRTPLGMDHHKARFVDIYEGPTLASGNYWLFSATLEVIRRPLLPDGSTAMPELILNPEILDIAINRKWPID